MYARQSLSVENRVQWFLRAAPERLIAATGNKRKYNVCESMRHAFAQG
jgi:hypothetical protein